MIIVFFLFSQEAFLWERIGKSICCQVWTGPLVTIDGSKGGGTKDTPPLGSNSFSSPVWEILDQPLVTMELSSSENLPLPLKVIIRQTLKCQWIKTRSILNKMVIVEFPPMIIRNKKLPQHHSALTTIVHYILRQLTFKKSRLATKKECYLSLLPCRLWESMGANGIYTH